MVVKVAVMIGWRMWRHCRSLPRTAFLLAGIAIMPTQSGGIPTQSEGISLLLPGLGVHAIEELAGGSQARAIAPTSFGNFAWPIGSADPALSAAFGWSAVGLPEREGADPAGTALLSGTVAAGPEELGAGGGVPMVRRTALGGSTGLRR